MHRIPHVHTEHHHTYNTQNVAPDADPAWDSLLADPSEALEIIFPREQYRTHKPDSCSERDWSNHVYAMHAVVFELCCLADEGRRLLPLMLEADEKLHPDAPRTPVPLLPSGPAHQFTCMGCRNRVNMSRSEVDWFKEKGFALPRRCKACRKGWKK